ncbi:MAG: ribonuclease H-like domain-containing protein [Ruminococcus sp.]|nr:ribonuclease H-like domain-containing protein [Ruminococcus sp.]
MKILKKELSDSLIKNKSYNMYFENRNMAVFDIETTGLSPAHSSLILSGIITVIDGKRTAYEILAETLDDEENVILKTIEILESCDFLLTFNGKHFDMPFLKSRASKYNIKTPDMYNLDLYLILNGCAEFKANLPNLKQKTVETFLGLAPGRTDTITGKESIELFSHYLKTGDKDAEKKILLHNYDDIRQLYRLLSVIKYIDFHKSMSKRGFPASDAVIEKMQFKGKSLFICGKHSLNRDYISFFSEEMPCNFYFNKNGSFEMEIPLYKEQNIYFVDTFKLLGDFSSAVAKYPAYESGYLILKQGNQVNHLEINAFVISLLKNTLKTIG